MDEYLSTTLTSLKDDDYGNLTIVMGNESCDLDSAVSSLVYAMFLHWQYHQIKCKVCTKANRVECGLKDDLFVPILNVERADYGLKTEVAYVFSQNGINESHIVFRDDFNLQQLVAKSSPKVVLVDHHCLAAQDQFLAPYVTEIIDHRPLNNSCWKYKPDTRSTIELVGSCTTLVGQRIKDLSALMAKGVDFFNAYPLTAKMLHSTIILDTVNFSKELDKARPKDEEIVLFLESLFKPASPELYRKTELDRLMEAKADVSQLTAGQLLRKDAKTLEDILVVSFPILVQHYLQKSNTEDAMKEALLKTNCSVLVLLGMDLKEGMKRDAGIYACDTGRAVRLGTHLEGWAQPPLQLTPVSFCVPLCRLYQQNNLSATRKQYMPALTAFLNKIV